jgi:hypothetical protein
VPVVEEKTAIYSEKRETMSFSDRSNMAPRTAARLAREVRDLLVSPESGVCLVVDEATGLPANLKELTVRLLVAAELACHVGRQNRTRLFTNRPTRPLVSLRLYFFNYKT